MKNIKILLVLIGSALIASCSTDDVQDRPVIEGVDAPVLAAPLDGNVYTLSFEQKDNISERFVWSPANFGGDVEVNYTIQIDVAGNEFASPEALGSVNSATQLGVTGEVLNNTALSLGAAPFEASPFEVRVKSSVGSSMEMFSDAATVTIVPYTTESPKVYIVGSFLNASGYGDDWTPANAVPLSASDFGKTDFEGFVNIAVDGAEFKILPSNDSFDGDYGDTGDSNGSFSGSIEQEDEVNSGTPDGTAGYYLVKVDTEALTYSLEKTAWGVIGNATPTGWDSDSDMTYDASAKTWSVTLDLIAQQAPDNGLKFRANDAWDLNIGDSGADGTMEFSGDNISVPEDGNYTITLDLSNPRAYTYSLTLN